jgi:hypothetical protein
MDINLKDDQFSIIGNQLKVEHRTNEGKVTTGTTIKSDLYIKENLGLFEQIGNFFLWLVGGDFWDKKTVTTDNGQDTTMWIKTKSIKDVFEGIRGESPKRPLPVQVPTGRTRPPSRFAAPANINQSSGTQSVKAHTPPPTFRLKEQDIEGAPSVSALKQMACQYLNLLPDVDPQTLNQAFKDRITSLRGNESESKLVRLLKEKYENTPIPELKGLSISDTLKFASYSDVKTLILLSHLLDINPQSDTTLYSSALNQLERKLARENRPNKDIALTQVELLKMLLPTKKPTFKELREELVSRLEVEPTTEEKDLFKKLNQAGRESKGFESDYLRDLKTLYLGSKIPNLSFSRKDINDAETMDSIISLIRKVPGFPRDEDTWKPDFLIPRFEELMEGKPDAKISIENFNKLINKLKEILGNEYEESSEGSREVDPKAAYLEFLGLPEDATPQQINSAYRTKSRQLHPDKTKGNPELEEQFKIMQELKTKFEER